MQFLIFLNEEKIFSSFYMTKWHGVSTDGSSNRTAAEQAQYVGGREEETATRGTTQCSWDQCLCSPHLSSIQQRWGNWGLPWTFLHIKKLTSTLKTPPKSASPSVGSQRRQLLPGHEHTIITHPPRWNRMGQVPWKEAWADSQVAAISVSFRLCTRHCPVV